MTVYPGPELADTRRIPPAPRVTALPGQVSKQGLRGDMTWLKRKEQSHALRYSHTCCRTIGLSSPPLVLVASTSVSPPGAWAPEQRRQG